MGGLAPLPDSFRPLCKMVGVVGFDKFYRAKPAPPVIADATRSAMVAFSGGRDSIAAAIKMVRAGFKTTLFHVEGLNRAAGHREVGGAASLADLMGLPLVTIKVVYKGDPLHVENPLKNVFVLGAMIDAGLRLSVPADTYVLGTMETDRIGPAGIESEAGTSDYVDVLEQAMVGFDGVVGKGLRLATVLKSNTDSFLTVYQRHPELIEHSRSCFLSEAFAAAHRKRVEASFSVGLAPKRCGVCYKCAGEWLMLRAVRAVPANPKYQGYCVERLQNALRVFWGRTNPSKRDAVEFFFDKALLPSAAEFEA